MRIRHLTFAAGSSLALVALAACGSSGSSTTPTTSGASGGGATGELKVGIKFDQPGLGLKEGEKYTGFDVDVATYVAKELGYDASKIKWIQTPSPQRENMIQAGQVDIIVATYSISDKRKEKVSFAGPYFIAGQDLLVRADDTSITGVESLKDKQLCSVKGSTSAQNVKDKVPGVKLAEYDTYSKCVEALANGTVDALTTDDSILAGYAAQPAYKGKLKVVGKPFSKENYGIGLKKGDTALCGKVNAALTKMVSDGSWKKAIDDNLGPAGYTPGPGNPPTPAACS